MTTLAQRLIALSGLPAGTATLAEHMRAISHLGSGTLAQMLSAYSGLALGTATFAVHIMTDIGPAGPYIPVNEVVAAPELWMVEVSWQ